MRAHARHRVLCAAMSATAAIALTPSLADGQRLRAEVIGAMVEHRVTLGEAPERTVGAAFGAGIRAPIMSWIEARGHLIGGALSAQTPTTDDRRFGELEADVMVIPFPWIAFDVGATIRSYTAPLGRQRWMAARVGGELRVEFAEGQVNGTLRGALLPMVSVSGLESPSVAVSGGASLDYRRGDLSAGLTYRLERYDFPAGGGAQRLEQISSIAAQVGVKLPAFWRWR